MESNKLAMTMRAYVRVCLLDGRFRLKLISFRLLMKQEKKRRKQQTKAEKTVHSQSEFRSKSER